ncbi:hypothetical protein GCM10011594_11650 [Nakamurella endophytica]|uniref:DUF5709 domain-containing protein n=2 Tax=Nakamurella endophytica TaxID=1748367 RepID=A0A917SS27_9ACTN|nr:hypothetical protein GCM10011594_11650 [Nakamurella endophytica]
MVKDEGTDQIDDTIPGTEWDAADGVAEQPSAGETLDDRGLADPLDEGWVPPDRPSRVEVPTQSEEEEGVSLDDRLAEEEPDVSADDGSSLFDEDGEEVGGARSGRLVQTDEGAYPDTDDLLVASDVGIDGAAASAEEAAVHVIDEEEG